MNPTTLEDTFQRRQQYMSDDITTPEAAHEKKKKKNVRWGCIGNCRESDTPYLYYSKSDDWLPSHPGRKVWASARHTSNKNWPYSRWRSARHTTLLEAWINRVYRLFIISVYVYNYKRAKILFLSLAWCTRDRQTDRQAAQGCWLYYTSSSALLCCNCTVVVLSYHTIILILSVVPSVKFLRSKQKIWYWNKNASTNITHKSLFKSSFVAETIWYQIPGM